MNKKYLILIFCSLFLISSVSGMTGNLPGSGTKEDPWIVDSADDFLDVGGGEGGYYEQTSDIDFSSKTDYSYNNDVFRGNYDGNNHAIKNFAGDYQSLSFHGGGLFGRFRGGKIKNLEIVDMDLSGLSSKSSLDNAGCIGGVAQDNGKVINVGIKNCELPVGDFDEKGGFFGRVFYGRPHIENSYIHNVDVRGGAGIVGSVENGAGNEKVFFVDSFVSDVSNGVADVDSTDFDINQILHSIEGSFYVDGPSLQTSNTDLPRKTYDDFGSFFQGNEEEFKNGDGTSSNQPVTFRDFKEHLETVPIQGTDDWEWDLNSLNGEIFADYDDFGEIGRYGSVKMKSSGQQGESTLTYNHSENLSSMHIGGTLTRTDLNNDNNLKMSLYGGNIIVEIFPSSADDRINVEVSGDGVDNIQEQLYCSSGKEVYIDFSIDVYNNGSIEGELSRYQEDRDDFTTTFSTTADESLVNPNQTDTEITLDGNTNDGSVFLDYIEIGEAGDEYEIYGYNPYMPVRVDGRFDNTFFDDTKPEVTNFNVDNFQNITVAGDNFQPSTGRYYLNEGNSYLSGSFVVSDENLPAPFSQISENVDIYLGEDFNVTDFEVTKVEDASGYYSKKFFWRAKVLNETDSIQYMKVNVSEKENPYKYLENTGINIPVDFEFSDFTSEIDTTFEDGDTMLYYRNSDGSYEWSGSEIDGYANESSCSLLDDGFNVDVYINGEKQDENYTYAPDLGGDYDVISNIWNGDEKITDTDEQNIEVVLQSCTGVAQKHDISFDSVIPDPSNFTLEGLEIYNNDYSGETDKVRKGNEVYYKADFGYDGADNINRDAYNFSNYFYSESEGLVFTSNEQKSYIFYTDGTASVNDPEEGENFVSGTNLTMYDNIWINSLNYNTIENLEMKIRDDTTGNVIYSERFEDTPLSEGFGDNDYIDLKIKVASFIDDVDESHDYLMTFQQVNDDGSLGSNFDAYYNLSFNKNVEPDKMNFEDSYTFDWDYEPNVSGTTDNLIYVNDDSFFNLSEVEVKSNLSINDYYGEVATFDDGGSLTQKGVLDYSFVWSSDPIEQTATFEIEELDDEELSWTLTIDEMDSYNKQDFTLEDGTYTLTINESVGEHTFSINLEDSIGNTQTFDGVFHIYEQNLVNVLKDLFSKTSEKISYHMSGLLFTLFFVLGGGFLAHMGTSKGFSNSSSTITTAVMTIIFVACFWFGVLSGVYAGIVGLIVAGMIGMKIASMGGEN